VVWSQQDGPGILVRFREVRDREAAEALRDRYLEAVADAPLPAGAYYWHEIEGATVSTTSGEVLGTVRDVFRAGGGEVYVVRGGRRGEVLVPAVTGVVAEMAPHDGRIVIDPDALGLDEEPRQRRPRGRLTTRRLRARLPETAVGEADGSGREPPAAGDGRASHGPATNPEVGSG
jgi:hypothetical protein